MKFTKRFNIEIDHDEAKRRFVNRAYNRIFSNFFYNKIDSNTRYKIHTEIVSALGDRRSSHQSLSEQIGYEFFRNLLALETFYQSLDYYKKVELDMLIKQLIDESEFDINIRWVKGRFLKSGAKLLDEKLVNDILDWLREKQYASVLAPFEKGLEHFLHSEKRPELLSDVVTDMYEALEALSKIITKRPQKDLSANRELFISKVKASNEYKKILMEYISYANEFRHASEEGKNKPSVSQREVESFIYLTGLFIRLAIQ